MGFGLLTASWEDEIAEVAQQFMTATIEVFDVTESEDPYDPETGEGGEPVETSLYTGLARVQQIRQPRDISTNTEWGTNRNFRFQLPYNELDVFSKGQRIRVLVSDRDASLENLIFVIQSAVNSDHRAVRTIEAVTDGVSILSRFDLFPSDSLFPSEELYPV